MKEFTEKYGFIKYAELSLDESKTGVAVIPNDTKHNVIYAIFIDEDLVYIGKTKNLKKRINYYRTSMNRPDTHSDKTKSLGIFNALKENKKVCFYSRQCFNLSMTNELGTMSVCTTDLEEPMFIKLFNPPWNTQHKRAGNATVILKPNESL